jgi:CyaY protein
LSASLQETDQQACRHHARPEASLVPPAIQAHVSQGGVRARHYTSALIDLHCRILLTMTTPELSDADYQRLAFATLSAVEKQCDAWLDQDVIDVDTHRSGGLLELAFPNGSKIILNTQPPLKELWLATRGGGFHFHWVGGQWVDTRDGQNLMDCLSHHASQQAGLALRFDLV